MAGAVGCRATRRARPLRRRSPRQALHAAILGFAHPVTGAEMAFEAPLPADMAGLLDALRGGAG